jgi:probable rRNA maturation factor
MELVIHKETAVRLPRRRLARVFAAVVAAERADRFPAKVNLVFTTDVRIRRLNREYRAKDKPTDVLSFNIDSPAEPDGVLGEIYVSVPQARRQAADYGASPAEEILRLTCHGLLHLFGYDHMKPAERARMEAAEARCLGCPGRKD